MEIRTLKKKDISLRVEIVFGTERRNNHYQLKSVVSRCGVKKVLVLTSRKVKLNNIWHNKLKLTSFGQPGLDAIKLILAQAATLSISP